MSVSGQPSHAAGCYDTCAIIVTFNPDPAHLREQLASLASQCEILVVDNGSPGPVREQIAASDAVAYLVELQDNRGIAHAQNAGLAHVAEHLPHCRYVLLLDHDSLPGAGFVDQLRRCYQRLAGQHPVALVGPALYDPRSGHYHGFHVMQGLLYKRLNPATLAGDCIECVSINSSGSFGELAVIQQVGPLNEDFFIDQVETDWCLRAIEQGLKLFGTTAARLDHYMGDDVLQVRLPGRSFYFPYRSPLRHRYLFRNSVTLLRQSFVPWNWKLFCIAKLLFTLALFGLFSPERGAQIAGMLRGVRDGIAGRGGPIATA